MATEVQRVDSRERTRPLVFFHLAKTGGSSIWSALTTAASNMSPPVQVLDLYHLSRTTHQTVAAVDRVLTDSQNITRASEPVLMHHHTAFPLEPFLDRKPVYTTIVRDPVERFISEVNHIRAVLRGEWDSVHREGLIDPRVEMEGRGWPQHLIEKAMADDVSLEQLLEFALQEPTLVRFYYWNFYHLLLGPPGVQVPAPLPPDAPSNQALAKLVQSSFAYIGRYPFVFQAYLKIIEIYGFRVDYSFSTFPHLIQRNSGNLVPGQREEMKAFFKDDYALLAKLGHYF